MYASATGKYLRVQCTLAVRSSARRQTDQNATCVVTSPPSGREVRNPATFGDSFPPACLPLPACYVTAGGVLVKKRRLIKYVFNTRGRNTRHSRDKSASGTYHTSARNQTTIFHDESQNQRQETRRQGTRYTTTSPTSHTQNRLHTNLHAYTHEGGTYVDTKKQKTHASC